MIEGSHHTREALRKMSLARMGLHPSEETRRKMSKRKRGARHPNWKGGMRKDGQGYIHIYSPEHPHCDTRKCVREHRLVMEAHLGRYLEPREIVHHRNEMKDDNRIENLRLKTKPIHMRGHAKESCARRHRMGRYCRDRPDVTVKKVKALIEQSLSHAKIAKRFHVSQRTIYRRMKNGDPVSFQRCL